MLRGAALLTALSCVLLAFLAADGVRAGSPTTTIQPNWSNISNTTLITVPDVRNRVWGGEKWAKVTVVEILTIKMININQCILYLLVW